MNDRMTIEELKARRRFLKRQALDLIRADNEVKIKIALTKIRYYYARQIRKDFDPTLSRKIDCLTSVLEE